MRDFAKKGLNVVILQPTVVYGPGGFWSTCIVEQLSKGTVVLPDAGRGACNAVYIDDVVDAAFLAANAPAIDGETFIIAGPEPVTWRQYYESYGKYVAGSRIEEAGADKVLEIARTASKGESSLQQLTRIMRTRPDLRQRLRRFPIVEAGYRAATAVIPTGALDSIRASFYGRPLEIEGETKVFPPLDHVPLLAYQQRVSIERAKRVLGYVPRFSLETGTRLTVAWMRWAVSA